MKAEIEAIVGALNATGTAEELRKKTILLTGAGGLLGNYFVEAIRALNEQGFLIKLLALDSKAEIEKISDHKQIFGVRHDLLSDRPLPSSADRFDFVVHAAGLASPVLYMRYPLETIDVAVVGSRKCLEVAKRDGAKYLFTSTSEIYQTPPDDQVPTPEDYIGAVSPINDRSPYDVSKLLGETLAYVYWRQHGVHTLINRYFNSFGVWLIESDRRILARLASSLISGEALTVYGHPNNLPTRTYCPAANAIYGLILTLIRGKPATPYNIGMSEPEITVPDLCLYAERVLGRPVPYRILPPPDVYKTEPKRRCPDIRRAQQDLGYAAIVSLETGLKNFLDWALTVYTGRS